MSQFIKIGTTLAVSLLSTAVWADANNGYGVATATRAQNAYDGLSFLAAFRTGQDSSFNHTRPGDVPSKQVNAGCQGVDPFFQCSGGMNGTSGTDFNLTASNSAALRSSYLSGPNQIGTGTASSRANLATGELAVVAQSDLFASFSGFPTVNFGQAYAQTNDSLRFNVAGANASTTTLIGVDFILNGGWARTDPRGGTNVQTRLDFGGAHALFNAGTNFAAEGMHQDGGWASASWVTNPSGSFHFTGVYALMGASNTFGFNQFLLADAVGGASASYGSTSHFLLTLPGNVSFDSNSTVFLSAVPEPGNTALMLAGLGVLAFMLHRRSA